MKTEIRPTLKLKNVRISFPHLHIAKPDKDNPSKAPKFEATFILDKKENATDIAAMQTAIELLKKDPVLKGKKLAKCCLRDGADTDGRANTDGYGAGVMTVGARNSRRQYVVDRDGKTPLSEQDNKCLGGDYVNAMVELYPFVHPTGGAMVCASLGNVQFVKEGERFGSAPNSPDKDFTPVEETEDAVG